MSYEKQTWASGDIITAEKLNHIEDGIEEPIGYAYSENENVLFDETVTTRKSEYTSYCEGEITYGLVIQSKFIRVIFDGKSYDLMMMSLASKTIGYGSVYGDFSEIPFGITSNYIDGAWHNTLMTAEEGTHSIKVSALYVQTKSVTPSFYSASAIVIGDVVGAIIFPVHFNWNAEEIVLSSPSYEDVSYAYTQTGTLLVGELDGVTGLLTGIEDVYGTKNFIFNFMKADVDSTTVQFTTVKLKSGGEVSHSVKNIALTE